MQPWAIKKNLDKNNNYLSKSDLFLKNDIIGLYLLLVILGFFLSISVINISIFDLLFKNYSNSRDLIPWHFVSIMFFNIQVCQPKLIANHRYTKICFTYLISILFTFFIYILFKIEVIFFLLVTSLISSLLILFFSKTERKYILLHLFISIILISYYFLMV